MVTGSYHKTYLLPLYADRQFYRMGWEADYFGWVKEAWDRSRQIRLTRTDVLFLSNYDAWWMKRTGNPYQYLQIGEDIIGIYHKPSANGIVLELDCVCIPKAYSTDNDPIKIRDVFQRASVYYAAGEYYASRGDAKRGAEYLNKYLETSNLMVLHPDTAERHYQYKGQNGKFQQ